MKELMTIQTELVAPKARSNDFAKYSYRNLEDICEAVRPLLKKLECTLTFTDDVAFIEGRFYIKSICTLTNKEGKSISATGYAREADGKKGMDESQVTGMASSYARKYAACSLMCISGADDADSMDNRDEKPQETKPTPKPETKPSKPILTESSQKWQDAVKYASTKNPEDLRKWYSIDDATMNLLKSIKDLGNGRQG